MNGWIGMGAIDNVFFIGMGNATGAFLFFDDP